MEIKVLKNIYGANDQKAEEIRGILSSKRVLMLNLIGSPGSGKTTIIEKTLDIIKTRYNIAIIEGDVATDRDARRLQKYGFPVTLINTDGACHLEALSIEKALEGLKLDETGLIFIENVGNLVCPAEFDIGEHAKIAVLSIPEGDDKPAKYPLLFTEASAVILNKKDLVPYSNFNFSSFYKDLSGLNPRAPVFEISCYEDKGFEKWTGWIEEMIKK
jgi:hydrogenase nickel incorporation protein HypB